jgi:hypothetical protein
MEWVFAGWILINVVVALALPVMSVKPQEGVWKA